MRHKRYILCVAGLAALAATGVLRADDGRRDLRSSLVGTWRMVSMMVNGQKNDLPQQSVTLKHVTPSGFTWLSYLASDGKIFRSGGGTWQLDGSTYSERIVYGMGDDFPVIKDTHATFKARVEGNTWRHTGKLANGITLDEVWERVMSKDGAR